VVGAERRGGNEVDDEELFRFLDSLRKSGLVNMFASPSVMVDMYGLTRTRARKVFMAWAAQYRDRDP
jgi:hypothetical protein